MYQGLKIDTGDPKIGVRGVPKISACLKWS
jgi:hypothetical protein